MIRRFDLLLKDTNYAVKIFLFRVNMIEQQFLIVINCYLMNLVGVVNVDLHITALTVIY